MADKFTDKHVTAIILAAGCGSRMGAETTKQRIELLGESVLKRTVSVFQKSSVIDSVVIVVREDEVEWARAELCSFDKITNIVCGGKNRAESAIAGFNAIPDECDFVAIHDGARCLVTVDTIEKVVKNAVEKGCATAATPLSDTLKNVDQNQNIKSTISRKGLYTVQTPQVFDRSLYKRAVESITDSSEITDDNMMLEMIGADVAVVVTDKNNIKITTPEDLEYARFIIERSVKVSEIRIGHGYDVHRLVEGRKLVLGGVEIDHPLGLLGHSDADVLTHAVMDALLGAAGLGDIGRHFPDTSVDFKDISSLLLLEKVKKLLESRDCSVVNIDATLILQKPKIAPYIDQMIENYANILDIERSRINIKATTEEGLGFTGREEGVSAHAVATISIKL